MSDLDFLGQDFNPQKAVVDGGGAGDDYSPLPPGWYHVTVSAAEVQDTKAGNGKMVFFRLDVTGPSHAGRVLFDRQVVAHPNPDAVRIGRARFGEACLAAGFDTKPSDTKAFIGRSFEVKVKTERSKQYGDQSRPVAYRASKGVAGVDGAGGYVADEDIPF